MTACTSCCSLIRPVAPAPTEGRIRRNSTLSTRASVATSLQANLLFLASVCVTSHIGAAAHKASIQALRALSPQPVGNTEGGEDRPSETPTGQVKQRAAL